MRITRLLNPFTSAHTPLPETTPRGASPPEATYQKVGVLLTLLLLFAGPAFYVMLFFGRYTRRVRIGWGLWVGLILFTALTGMSEDAIPIQQMFQEAGVGPEVAAEEELLSLEQYLGRLGGRHLGYRTEDFSVSDGAASEEDGGAAIEVRYKRDDGYFESEQAVAQNAIGGAFSLIYGREFRRVVFIFDLQGRTLRMDIERGAFNRFFGLSEDQMRAAGESRDAFALSPVATADEAEQRRFFAEFGRYEGE